MAAQKKQDDTTKVVALVAIIVIALGFGFFRGKAKTRTTSTTRPGAASVGGSPGSSSSPGGAASGAPTVTPAMIPQLSDDEKKRIRDRRASDVALYPKEKLEAGTNPFVPYTVDMADLLQKARDKDDDHRPGRGPEGKKRRFNRKLTFWGAFSPSPDEPKRVIIEVQNEPQPWTGLVGEIVEGTPYRVVSLGPNEQSVTLAHAYNSAEPPLTLRFEGMPDDSSGDRPRRALSDKEQQDADAFFGGKSGSAVAPAGGDRGGPPPSGAGAGRPSREPALEK